MRYINLRFTYLLTCMVVSTSDATAETLPDKLMTTMRPVEVIIKKEVI